MAATKSKYVTLSVKVRREVKEQLEQARIKPGEVMRKALSDALDDAAKRKLVTEWTGVRGIFEKIPEERIRTSIRENRERSTSSELRF
jgi:hypothetical protein